LRYRHASALGFTKKLSGPQEQLVVPNPDQDKGNKQPMASFNVAVIGGDGIGPEVIEQAIRVADVAARRDGGTIGWQRFPWGCTAYLRQGRMMPEDGFDTLQKYDAILFGAVGSPEVPDHLSVSQLLLPMRRRFDQYVNLRPAYLYEGVQSPLRDKAPGSIDMVVYRENTEGEYAPIGGHLHAGFPAEVAVQTSVFTWRGCERIMRAAFEGARKRRKKVTSISKSNALGFSMVLWDRVFADVCRDYPDVEANSLLVDAAAMDFVRRPESFDVVVASNLFGDILTDLSAVVTAGSVGLAASGNINPERKYPSLFEPVHGSAPDIAGKGIANPLAAILSAAMLLEHLHLDRGAAALHQAVAAVLRAGKVRTPDLGGKAKTQEMGDAVLASL
jgi:tartrate dehydrogenase/decarboxylase/D-malate dehydrogenase